MSTRRAFLKCLGALGAGLLPWTSLPELLAHCTQPGQASFQKPQPTELSTVNSEQETNASYLKRTAFDDILALTQRSLEGRRAGTLGEEKAAEYLIKQLQGLGLKPLGDRMENQQQIYLNAFTIYPVVEEFVNHRLTFRKGDPNSLRTPSANVIGGMLGVNSQESVILSAHYDHLGIFQDNLYPGANDNASGVGCILDVMRRLIKEGIKPKRNVVLAFWSAEEMGFVGSYSFLSNPTIPRDGIQAVFNVDSVGNGPRREFALWADSHNLAVKTIQTAVAKYKASADLTPNNGYNSDQVYFNLDHIPAVTLMARDWLYKNHTPEDVPSFVDPQKIALASDILYDAVHVLAY